MQCRGHNRRRHAPHRRLSPAREGGCHIAELRGRTPARRADGLNGGSTRRGYWSGRTRPDGPIVVTANGHHPPVVLVEHHPRRVLIEILLALLDVAQRSSLLHRPIDDAAVVVLRIRKIEALHLGSGDLHQVLHRFDDVESLRRLIRTLLDQIQEGVFIVVDHGSLLLRHGAPVLRACVGILQIGAVGVGDFHRQGFGEGAGALRFPHQPFFEQAKDDKRQHLIQRHFQDDGGFRRGQPTFDPATLHLRDGRQVIGFAGLYKGSDNDPEDEDGESKRQTAPHNLENNAGELPQPSHEEVPRSHFGDVGETALGEGDAHAIFFRRRDVLVAPHGDHTTVLSALVGERHLLIQHLVKLDAFEHRDADLNRPCPAHQTAVEPGGCDLQRSVLFVRRVGEDHLRHRHLEVQRPSSARRDGIAREMHFHAGIDVLRFANVGQRHAIDGGAHIADVIAAVGRSDVHDIDGASVVLEGDVVDNPRRTVRLDEDLHQHLRHGEVVILSIHRPTQRQSEHQQYQQGQYVTKFPFHLNLLTRINRNQKGPRCTFSCPTSKNLRG